VLFPKTVWRLVWPDIKPSFQQSARIAVETVVVIPLVCLCLFAWGSGIDSFLEGAVFTLLGALSLVAVHIMWSVLKVPWKLYCELSTAISEIRDKMSNRPELPLRSVSKAEEQRAKKEKKRKIASWQPKKWRPKIERRRQRG
jgi:hypothetical protein